MKKRKTKKKGKRGKRIRSSVTGRFENKAAGNRWPKESVKESV